MELIDFITLVLAFLSSLNFAINPVENKMDLIHGLVISSFIGEEKVDEALLSINDQLLEIWKEVP
jgi:hypothetical protein